MDLSSLFLPRHSISPSFFPSSSLFLVYSFALFFSRLSFYTSFCLCSFSFSFYFPSSFSFSFSFSLSFFLSLSFSLSFLCLFLPLSFLLFQSLLTLCLSHSHSLSFSHWSLPTSQFLSFFLSLSLFFFLCPVPILLSVVYVVWLYPVGGSNSHVFLLKKLLTVGKSEWQCLVLAIALGDLFLYFVSRNFSSFTLRVYIIAKKIFTYGLSPH